MALKRIFGLAAVAIILTLFVLGALNESRSPPPPKYVPRVPIYIAVSSGGITVDGRPSSLDALAYDISSQSRASEQAEQEIHLYAEPGVKYETFAEVRQRVETEGWTKIKRVNISKPDQ